MHSKSSVSRLELQHGDLGAELPTTGSQREFGGETSIASAILDLFFKTIRMFRYIFGYFLLKSAF